MTELLLNEYTWMSLGIILIILEMVADGSLTYFLPMGASAIIIGGIIKMQSIGYFPNLFDGLIWKLVIWMVFSILISFILQKKFATKQSKLNTDDVNNY